MGINLGLAALGGLEEGDLQIICIYCLKICRRNWEKQSHWHL